MYALAESLRSWLEEHNEPPGDGSGFEEMVRSAVLLLPMWPVLVVFRACFRDHRCGAKKPPPRQPRRLLLQQHLVAKKILPFAAELGRGGADAAG